MTPSEIEKLTPEREVQIRQMLDPKFPQTWLVSNWTSAVRDLLTELDASRKDLSHEREARRHVDLALHTAIAERDTLGQEFTREVEAKKLAEVKLDTFIHYTEAGSLAELRSERDAARAALSTEREATNLKMDRRVSDAYCISDGWKDLAEQRRATIEAWKPLLVTVRGYLQSIDDCGEACVEMMQMMGRIDAALAAEKERT